MNKDKKPKGVKIDKDRLKIKGSLDDVLKASIPKKPKSDKE